MPHIVAIVGRPNVGKSALFNRIAGRQISLVYDQPGVTRDRIATQCRFGDKSFELVDTGGIGLEDKDGFAEAIDREAEIAFSTATEILLVVDAREGLTPLDRDVAKRLRRIRQPVYVVANKADSEKQNHFEAEFVALGFGEPMAVSAAHGRGIEELMERLTASWPEEAAEEKAREDRPTRIAILGRPNVGKSSLVNALLQDERTIVSPVAGTTRDNVDVPFTWKERPYTLIDTAGLRQQRRMEDKLEQAMSGRSAHAVNRAEVCVLVIDAQTGVSMQDKKIAGLIHEAQRACIIVINKWDLARELGDGGKEKQREYFDEVRRQLFFLTHAPVLFISAKTGERMDGLMMAVEDIAKYRHFRFLTGPLNRVLQEIQQRNPAPSVSGKRFKIYYGAQKISEDTQSVPTLILFVNEPRLLVPAYRRYLELHLAQAFKVPGCPILLELKARTGRKPAQRQQH